MCIRDRSKGGKSFLCCSSAFKGHDGEIKSRIVPTLTPGDAITATRTNLNYFVTEYGIVNLKGMTTWQRAEKLISVAHPDAVSYTHLDVYKRQAFRSHILEHKSPTRKRNLRKAALVHKTDHERVAKMLPYA